MSNLVTEGLVEGFGHGRDDRWLLQGTPPAAGLEFTFVIPGSAVHRPVSAVFTLTTDGNAGNRSVTVTYEGGDTLPFAVSGGAAAVTANKTQLFACSTSRASTDAPTGGAILFPLATDFLDPATTFAIRVANIQAGDTLTNIRVVFDRFFTGPRGERQGAVAARRRSLDFPAAS